MAKYLLLFHLWDFAKSEEEVPVVDSHKTAVIETDADGIETEIEKGAEEIRADLVSTTKVVLHQILRI
jgi:2-polyprenyl-6-methoxyphenol hydroxylase-like FAD-dependent oxidoreductase